MGAKEMSIGSIKSSFEESYYKKYQRNDKEADSRNTKQDFFNRKLTCMCMGWCSRQGETDDMEESWKEWLERGS